jgi:Homoserine dehydrogenase
MAAAGEDSHPGIDSIADPTRGYQLIARARRTLTGISASVGLEWSSPDSFLGQARGPENRIEIDLTSGEVVRLLGQGAGRWPTALSVLGDLHEVARIAETFRCADRSESAARAFFSKALETHQPRRPRKVNLDGNAATHRALRLFRAFNH